MMHFTNMQTPFPSLASEGLCSALPFHPLGQTNVVGGH